MVRSVLDSDDLRAGTRRFVDELARPRRDAPQTEIGEGARDAMLMTLGSAAVGKGC